MEIHSWGEDSGELNHDLIQEYLLDEGEVASANGLIDEGKETTNEYKRCQIKSKCKSHAEALFRSHS